jgi:hypothetical protein
LQKQRRMRNSRILWFRLQLQPQLLEWRVLQKALWLLMQEHLLLQHRWQLLPRGRGGVATARRSSSRKCLQQQQQEKQQGPLNRSSKRSRCHRQQQLQRLQV